MLFMQPFAGANLCLHSLDGVFSSLAGSPAFSATLPLLSVRFPITLNLAGKPVAGWSGEVLLVALLLWPLSSAVPEVREFTISVSPRFCFLLLDGAQAHVTVLLEAWGLLRCCDSEVEEPDMFNRTIRDIPPGAKCVALISAFHYSESGSTS